MNKLSHIRAADWNRYMNVIFESILKDEAPIHEPKMNIYLEETVENICIRPMIIFP